MVGHIPAPLASMLLFSVVFITYIADVALLIHPTRLVTLKHVAWQQLDKSKQCSRNLRIRVSQSPSMQRDHPTAESVDHTAAKQTDFLIKSAPSQNAMGLPKDLRTWDVPPGSSLIPFSSLCSPPHSPSLSPVLSSLSFLLSHSGTSASFLSRPARKQISAVAVYLLTQQGAPIRGLFGGSPSPTIPRHRKMQSASSVAIDLYTSIFCSSGLRSRVCSGHYTHDSITPEGNVERV